MSEVTTRYPVTTATVGGRVIHPGEYQGKCAVLRDGDVMVLSIGAPCCFSIDPRHAAQVHRFHGGRRAWIQMHEQLRWNSHGSVNARLHRATAP